MISCIVCSRYSALSERLVQNIQHTIGASFELVVLDNSKNKYSIFSAYNEGVRRAKGEFLCFMHEDILFHSQNWGQELCRIFEDDTIGLIGVLGTQFMPDTPSAWWWTGCTVGHVLQSVNDRLGENNTYINGNPVQEDVDAVIVDGLFMCMRREMFDRIRFDDQSFDSFHCYDHDVCMQVLSLGKRIIIAHGIIIEHASVGNVGKEFINQLNVFYNKWEKSFPIMRGLSIDSVGMERMKRIIKMLYGKNLEVISLKGSKKYRFGQALSNLIHPFNHLK